ATFLTLPTAFVIGHSVEGRPIDAVHVGGNGPVVLVVGCIHGNECAALPVVHALEHARPRGEDLWVIPEADPDGAAHDERLNAHGVDLNRNFPKGWRPGAAPLAAAPRAAAPAGPRAPPPPPPRARRQGGARPSGAPPGGRGRAVGGAPPRRGGGGGGGGGGRAPPRRYARAVGMRYRGE